MIHNIMNFHDLDDQLHRDSLCEWFIMWWILMDFDDFSKVPDTFAK